MVSDCLYATGFRHDDDLLFYLHRLLHNFFSSFLPLYTCTCTVYIHIESAWPRQMDRDGIAAVRMSFPSIMLSPG